MGDNPSENKFRKKKEQRQYSVLMSVYCREKAGYLRESIESMLAQTLPPSDFVIVCDGPLTEELDAVLAQYTAAELFQIIRLPENVGLGRALNAGLGHCRFDYVARMDSDDISMPERCEKELSVLLEKGLDLVSGSLVEFSDCGMRESGTETGKIRRLPQTQEEILHFARRRNPFNHPCVMYRKSSVEKAGGYVHCEGFEDYHLWVRMLHAGMKGYNLPDILLRMRTSGMYDRRGGLHYAKNIIHFRLFMWRSGFCSFGDFLYASAGHVAVSILPAGLRRVFYNTLLRKTGE